MTRVGAVTHAACGTVQLLLSLSPRLVVGCDGAGVRVPRGWRPRPASSTPTCVPSPGAGTFFGFALLPIVGQVAARRAASGRASSRCGVRSYLRFWLVKTLIRANPLTMFTGSPLHLMYLRALGARIGKGAVVLSPRGPRVPGPAHGRAGHRGPRGLRARRATAPRPAGSGSAASRWARRRRLGEDGARHRHRDRRRRAARALLLAATRPAGAGRASTGTARRPSPPTRRPRGAAGPLRHRAPVRYSDAAAGNLFLLAPDRFRGRRRAVAARAVDGEDPRGRAPQRVGPDPVRPIAAVFARAVLRRDAHRAGRRPPPCPGSCTTCSCGRTRCTRSTASATGRTGSSGAPPTSSCSTTCWATARSSSDYLTAIGYDLSQVQQTGSNFGASSSTTRPTSPGRHRDDGLRRADVLNTDVLQHLVPDVAGDDRRAQLPGQQLAYPAGAPRRRQLLLATKAMLPLDGPVRARRRAARARRPSRSRGRCSATRSSTDLRPASCGGWSGKNRYNLRHHRAAPARALVRCRSPRWSRRSRPSTSTTSTGPLGARRRRSSRPRLFGLGYASWSSGSLGFRRMSPQFCSIYDPYFWWHERLWKLLTTLRRLQRHPVQAVSAAARGPDRPARASTSAAACPRRPWSRSGTTSRSTKARMIQGHSLEDGAFKSDRIVVGAGARSASAPSCTTA